MLRIIAIIVGCILVYNSVQSIFINSTPFKGDIASLEKSGAGDYDNFELTGANAVRNYSYFLHDGNKSDQVKQYFFALASKQLMDEMDSEKLSLIVKYAHQAQVDSTITEQQILDSVSVSQQIKPQIFLQSSSSIEMSKNEYENMIDSFTNKNVAGIKIQTGLDLDDKIKDGLKNDGVDLDKTLIILHNQTPGESRGIGIVILVMGLLLILYGLTIFIKK